jgi:hypothetical protein
MVWASVLFDMSEMCNTAVFAGKKKLEGRRIKKLG